MLKTSIAGNNKTFLVTRKLGPSNAPPELQSCV